ncbi:MAG: hypothetical protein PHE01_02785, partial [Methanosarcina sp.]|nr:hypothetical protein [Methanosarcina sp.]
IYPILENTLNLLKTFLSRSLFWEDFIKFFQVSILIYLDESFQTDFLGALESFIKHGFLTAASGLLKKVDAVKASPLYA